MGGYLSFGGNTFKIVGRAFLAPCHCETINLGPIHDVRHGFGGFAQSNRQHARGKRIKRTGMAGLFGIEQPLDLRDRFGRSHALRLVKMTQPETGRPFSCLVLPCFIRLHCGRLRPRRHLHHAQGHAPLPANGEAHQSWKNYQSWYLRGNGIPAYISSG